MFAMRYNLYIKDNFNCYLEENKLTPGTNDGIALGDTSLGFSDLYLADGGAKDDKGMIAPLSMDDIRKLDMEARRELADENPTPKSTVSPANNSKLSKKAGRTNRVSGK